MSAPVSIRATMVEAFKPLPSHAHAFALILGGLLLISP
jgi:hypothetical protein